MYACARYAYMHERDAMRGGARAGAASGAKRRPSQVVLVLTLLHDGESAMNANE